MIYKVVILEEAKIDYKKSLLYYKGLHPKLAERFNDTFKESISIIRKDPLLFQINTTISGLDF